MFGSNWQFFLMYINIAAAENKKNLLKEDIKNELL